MGGNQSCPCCPEPPRPSHGVPNIRSSTHFGSEDVLRSSVAHTYETWAETGCFRIILPGTVAGFEQRSSDVKKRFRLSASVVRFGRSEGETTTDCRSKIAVVSIGTVPPEN